MPRSLNHKNVVSAYRRALQRQQEVGFDRLQVSEKELIATLLMNAEIRNGGFFQWFTNAHSDHAGYAIQFLQRVGAQDLLGLVARACALFPDGKIPATQKERWDWASTRTEEKVESLRQIDKEYYALKRDLYDDMVELIPKSN